jgi:hypothetical protein
MKMDKSTAGSLLARLAAQGVPPTELHEARRLISAFSVGVDDWVERLSNTYLRGLCTADKHVKLVLAPYGGGKTHFLLSVAARASQDNFAVAFISCIPDGPGAPSRIDNPLGMYQDLAARLTLPDRPGVGVEALVQAFVESKRRAMLDGGVSDLDSAFRLVKRGLSSELPRHACGDFAEVLGHAASGIWDSSSDDITAMAALKWLEGRFTSMHKDDWLALGLKAPAIASSSKVGRELLNGLTRLCRMSGFVGLALLIDEVETLFTARGKALNKILSAMRVMIDPSDASQIPMLCIFSATPDVVPQMDSYPALQQRLSVVGASFAEGNDYAPQIDLSRLDIDQLSLLKQIGQRLISLAVSSAPGKLDPDTQTKNSNLLAEVAAKRNLDVDARRLFVKCWASLLSLQIQTGEKSFDSLELSNRYAGDLESIRKADKEFEA